MAALNLTSFDPILKQHYVNKRIFSLSDLNNPFLSLVPKDTKGGGKYIYQPIDYEGPGGGSADVAVAVANQTASGYEDFQITRKKHYQVAKIDGETIEASLSNPNAFFPALKEIDKAFKQAGRSIARKLYRPAGGYLGRLESGTTLTGAVANLDDHADAFNFQVGQKIGFSADPGTGSLRGSPTYLTVSDINREGGTITFSANLETVTSIADTDYMFVEGDHNACPSGLADWVPTSAPGATAFYGVDRTTDDRLGGLRRTASGEPLMESLIKGTATCEKHGAVPSHVFANPEVVSDLLLEIHGKLVYERATFTSKRAPIGFKGAEVIAGNSTVKVIGDVNCPTNRMYILQLDTWTLWSAGQCPMFSKRAGLLQEGTTTDDYSCRIKGYFNLGCSAPGKNMVVDLS